MGEFDDAFGSVRKWLVGSIVLYFALVLYGILTGSETVQLVAHAFFGCIAVGMGGMLVRHASEQSPTMAAGVALVAGGLAQFGWIATGSAALGDVATVGVLFGIGLYIFDVRFKN